MDELSDRAFVWGAFKTVLGDLSELMLHCSEHLDRHGDLPEPMLEELHKLLKRRERLLAMLHAVDLKDQESPPS